jgi:hypothetical protein
MGHFELDTRRVHSARLFRGKLPDGTVRKELGKQEDEL